MKIAVRLSPPRSIFFAALSVLLWMGICPAKLPAREVPPAEEIKSPGPAYTRCEEVEAEVLRLREAEDSDGLDALAAELRKSGEAMVNGTWLLTYFYDTAVNVPDDEAEAEKAMAFYRGWAERKPESITAQICLAEALISYAWNAEGTEGEGDVSQETKSVFEERLAEAWQVLENAQKLNEKCPEWYSAALTVGLGEVWDEKRFMELVDEALLKYPSYGWYYATACYYLFPTEDGETGRFEKWIKEKANLAPPEKRDREYARFVWLVDALGSDSEIVFARRRLDWARVRKGFEEWLKESPQNMEIRFEYLRLALMANDRDVARAQFEATGEKYWPDLWGENKEDFEKARDFAFGGKENPLVSAPVKKHPSISPVIVERTAIVLRIVGGFIGGLLIGGLCLALAIRHGKWRAGLAVLIIAIVLAMLGGSMIALLPAYVFLLYLFLKAHDTPPDPPRVLSPWMGFLWLVVVGVSHLGLQIFATIFEAIPAGMAGGGDIEIEHFTTDLYQSGAVFRYTVNASGICFLLLLFLCWKRSREGYRKALGLFSFSWKRAIAFLIPAILLLYSVGWGLDGLADDKTKEAMEDMAYGASSPILMIFGVVLVAPVFEELLYRGFLFQAWFPKLGFWWTSLAGSLIFSICHFQYGWTGLVFIMFFSMLLYVLRWKTGSVIPSIFLHILNNAGSCLGLYLESQKLS